MFDIFYYKYVQESELCRSLVYVMGLLPDTHNCGLRMRRVCWERNIKT